MKILIINPNSDAETDERLRKKAAMPAPMPPAAPAPGRSTVLIP